jgi:hypothetical protein
VEAFDSTSNRNGGVWKVGPATSAASRTLPVAAEREGGRNGHEPRPFSTPASIRMSMTSGPKELTST